MKTQAVHSSTSPSWLHVPNPAVDGHKYDRGHALIVSGGMTSTGVARLATSAALRTGAGLVTLASPSGAMTVAAASVTAIMLVKADDGSELSSLLSDDRITACALGIGLGLQDLKATREKVLAVLAARKPTVLDADALTVFTNDPQTLFRAIDSSAVLTPHEGEFMRLFDASGTRNQRALLAAETVGAIVVLKSATTEIAAPDGRSHSNDHASPYLATAGSGDVLAGIIAGLLAQGMDPFDTARAAVWMHGDAGLRLGPGLIAEDLPDILPVVLSHIMEASHD